MKNIAVTLTTINMPLVLSNLIEQMEAFPHDGLKIDFIVAGDRKTPLEAKEYLAKLKSRYPKSEFIYLGLDDQEKRFSRHQNLWNHIPINSFARRNYADLLAYTEGYDTIIRIDDDNFPCEGVDFFGGHSGVGNISERTVVKSANGWFNVCETLEEENGVNFYPRGFPFTERWNKPEVTTTREVSRLVINAGLWLGDPDVDAITRLCRPVNATRFKSEMYGDSFTLAKGTWCPINTQNTAFAREVIPAAFVSPFAGRYDDILSGYFLRKLVDHMGDSVSFGQPLLNQIRNAHDLWMDLDKERIGGSTIHKTSEILRDIELTGKDYKSSFEELTRKFREANANEVGYYTKILDGMEIWSEVIRSL